MNRPQEHHCDLGEDYGAPVTEYSRPRRTPDSTKGPDHQLAGNGSEPNDQNSQKEPVMTSVNEPAQARPLDAVLDDFGVTDPAQRAEVAALFTPASPVDCLDGTVYAIAVNPTWKTVTATIAGSDPERPAHVMFDVDDLRALADALAELDAQEVAR